MPIYEYSCERCGKTFERIQKFSDEPLSVHEECGGSVHRLLSPPALQFKGSGWYVTDYARGSAGNGSAAKPDSKAGTKTESKTSETAPASKPAASPAPSGE